MSEHSFDSIVNDPLVREALPYLAPLPFIGSGTTPAGPVIAPAEIAGEILGVQPNLNDRRSLIVALERAFPLQKNDSGKSVVVYRPTMAEAVTMPRAHWPLVGPTATAAVALQTLVNHSPSLQQIRPIDPSSVDADEYESLIDLIRGAIERLAQQFASGHPVPQEIDATLFTLCGWKRGDAGTFPANPNALGGYLDELEERCGLEIGQMRSIDDEKVYTNFANLVALTGIFARAWEEVHNSGSQDFFLDRIHVLHRHLYGVVAAAMALRGLVPASAWTTVDVPTTPPLPSGQLIAWTLRAAGTTALEMLKQGRDGLFGVHQMMKAIQDAWATLRDDGAGPKQGTGYCAGVPGAFDDEETQEVLNQLLCHLDRVIAATTPPVERKLKTRGRYRYAAPPPKEEQRYQSGSYTPPEQRGDDYNR